LFYSKTTGTVPPFTKLAASADYPAHAVGISGQYMCCENAACGTSFGANKPTQADF